MPVSHHRHISTIMNRLDLLWNDQKFVSVLDIGIGFGKYGMLVRERFDVRFKRYRKEDFQLIIDGVEIYSSYISMHSKFIYDEIYNTDICELIPILSRYDVILILECLEHIDKIKGIELIRQLKNKTNSLLILSFPRSFKGNEGSDWPNKHERHLCLWTKEDLESILGDVEQLSPTIFAKQFGK